MRVDPELDEIVNGKRGMLGAIERCLQDEYLVSGVTLIFACIDALSALTRAADAARTTRDVFVKWVDRYMHPSEKLRCSALDLYAARCSVLHTYGTESDLSRAGEARPIVYEWRHGPRADAAEPLPDRALVLHVETLNRIFQDAVKEFVRDSEMDPSTKSRVEKHLKAMLCYRPWPQLIAQQAEAPL